MATKKSEAKIKEVKDVEATVVEKTAPEAEEKKTESLGLMRDVAYAYVGTIAQSITTVEGLINKIKTDRTGLFSELVTSGEEFTQSYQSKMKERTQNIKETLTPKKKAKEEEKEAEAA